MKKDIARVFRPHEHGLRKFLGELEAAIMDRVWAHGQATVRDVYEALKPERRIAYTTVMTTMGKLATKGLLKQHREGIAYTYTPTMTQEEFMKRATTEVITGLFDNFAEPLLNNLTDLLDEDLEEHRLKILENLLHERRG